MHCRICRSAGVRCFIRLGSRYGRCRTCGAVTKLLAEREYQALAPTYDPGPAYDAPPDELRRLLDVDEKARFLAPRLAGRGGGDRPRVLDIGCGQGGMLLAARDLGCEVLGVEPSERHSRTAREVFGLPVREGYFDAEAVLPDRFDLVILSHVIEHIFQPEAFLNVVMRVVIPGGLLVVVTPNADGSVARLTGRYWTMLKPMDHVSMLTPRAVRLMDLPEAAGLTIRQSEYVWEPLAGIVQALRDGVRERGDGAKPAAVINADAATARRHHLRRFLLAAGLLSAPLHAVNKVLAAQACLTIEIRKRAARGPGATAASRSSVPPGSRTPNAPPCLPV